MSDPLDTPPLDYGSDRHGYVELAYDRANEPPGSEPLPPATLVASLRCKDCLSNIFLRWDGERWLSTVAHDDGCPTFAQLR